MNLPTKWAKNPIFASQSRNTPHSRKLFVLGNTILSLEGGNLLHCSYSSGPPWKVKGIYDEG